MINHTKKPSRYADLEENSVVACARYESIPSVCHVKNHHSKIDDLPHYVAMPGSYEGIESDFYVIAPVINPLGIHARPSALIVKTYGRYNCDVNIQKLSDKKYLADASSVMGVITLAAHQGDVLIIRAKDRGNNEAQACVQNLADLVKAGFDEMDED